MPIIRWIPHINDPNIATNCMVIVLSRKSLYVKKRGDFRVKHFDGFETVNRRLTSMKMDAAHMRKATIISSLS